MLWGILRKHCYMLPSTRYQAGLYDTPSPVYQVFHGRVGLHSPRLSPIFSALLRESTMIVRKRLRIMGRVPGVAFRASTVAIARELGLGGWVANQADSSVEAVAECDDANVAAFVHWCHHGPPAARVDHVEVTEESVQGALPEPFTVR